MSGAEPYASKEEEEEARIGGALRNLERWGQQAGGSFTGHVKMQGQIIGPGRNEVSRIHTVAIGEQSPPDGMTFVPRGTSLEQISEMFKERDRLKAKAADEAVTIDPAAVTAAAISNVQAGRQTPIRVLKHRWLRWLYNAITKEQS